MDNTRLSRLVELIHEHYTWIDVLDYDKKELFTTLAWGEPETEIFHVLRFITKIPRNKYRKGKIISIPGPDLDRTIRSMCVDENFKNRFESSNFTIEDIEEIVYKATSNVLKLELENYY